jgi:hypothetical protein
LQSPYEILEDDNGYYFTTSSGIIYRIVFDDLDSVFSDYKTLKGRVFSYSFYPTIKQKGADERIKLTIAYSINEFFKNNQNMIVFVCDSTDERELCRKRLFDGWFSEFNINGNLEKFDGIVSGDDTSISNSIIMSSDLSDKAFVVKTFNALNDQFSRSK